MSTSSRPRPKTRLVIDPDNAYGRLGASPLATTDELKRILSDKRGAALAARRAKGQHATGDEEREIIELQAIEALIGMPATRAAYDREHPQNALLTVQAAPRDRAFDPGRTAGLVTAWLLEELGPEVMLLHPDAYWLWLPAGLEPELAAQLVQYAQSAPASGTKRAALPASYGLGDLDELGTLTTDPTTTNNQ
ncbi:MAG: hypothetical protein H0T79_06345 [Deltaproteobacteria bacterium]|nr:hypothetical protein [Deltaproteobacteria bacterium]